MEALLAYSEQVRTLKSNHGSEIGQSIECTNVMGRGVPLSAPGLRWDRCTMRVLFLLFSFSEKRSRDYWKRHSM